VQKESKAKPIAQPPIPICRKLCSALVLTFIIAAGYGCVICHDALHKPKTPPPRPTEYEEAENSFCYVCHINFDGEALAAVHKKANVGCADCHGDSDQHSADEDCITPPDIMYKKSDVNNFCITTCHSKEKLQKQRSHRPFFAPTDTQPNYCTNCHGTHNITNRQRKWDKQTGRLTFRDGYQIK